MNIKKLEMQFTKVKVRFAAVCSHLVELHFTRGLNVLRWNQRMFQLPQSQWNIYEV